MALFLSTLGMFYALHYYHQVDEKANHDILRDLSALVVAVLNAQTYLFGMTRNKRSNVESDSLLCLGYIWPTISLQ